MWCESVLAGMIAFAAVASPNDYPNVEAWQSGASFDAAVIQCLGPLEVVRASTKSRQRYSVVFAGADFSDLRLFVERIERNYPALAVAEVTSVRQQGPAWQSSVILVRQNEQQRYLPLSDPLRILERLQSENPKVEFSFLEIHAQRDSRKLSKMRFQVDRFQTAAKFNARLESMAPFRVVRHSYVGGKAGTLGLDVSLSDHPKRPRSRSSRVF